MKTESFEATSLVKLKRYGFNITGVDTITFRCLPVDLRDLPGGFAMEILQYRHRGRELSMKDLCITIGWIVDSSYPAHPHNSSHLTYLQLTHPPPTTPLSPFMSGDTYCFLDQVALDKETKRGGGINFLNPNQHDQSHYPQCRK